MTHDCKLSTKLGGLAVATFVRTLSSTLDFKIAHYDPAVDPAQPEFAGRYIYAFWHEYIALPTMLWGHHDVAVLISQHRDGEWITRAANHLGFETVRGSTTHGGAAALRELKRKSQSCHLTFTPDGPQGPRRRMSIGPIYLASRLGVPLVPVGFGYDRPWRMPTWDRFAVPRPFTRARAIFGPAVPVPRKLKRDGLEHFQACVEQVLNRLTHEAERWAESGGRVAGQRPFRPRPIHLRRTRRSPQPELVLAEPPPDADSGSQTARRQWRRAS